MNCDQPIELLPWLLNGTLGEDERREVREHLATCETCRHALAETRLAWEIFDQHIPTAALISLAAGETPEGHDAAFLDEHLATCPECAAELELVRTSRGLAEDDTIALLTPPPPRSPQTTTTAPVRALPARRAPVRWRSAALAAGLTGLVALGGWYRSAEHARDLAARLAAAPPIAGPVSRQTAGQAAPDTPSRPAWPQSAADARRIAAMQGQIETLSRKLGELQALEAAGAKAQEQLAARGPAPATPQINTWIGDVQGSADVVRGSNDTVAEVPPAKTATLLLRAPGEPAGEREIEIADAGGRVVWKAKGLRLNAESGDYSLTLPAGALPPGDYTIRLYRTESGQRVPARSYSIRLR
jgi:anti-sigma factor RsiW